MSGAVLGRPCFSGCYVFVPWSTTPLSSRHARSVTACPPPKGFMDSRHLNTPQPLPCKHAWQINNCRCIHAATAAPPSHSLPLPHQMLLLPVCGSYTVPAHPPPQTTHTSLSTSALWMPIQAPHVPRKAHLTPLLPHPSPTTRPPPCSCVLTSMLKAE